ncbi:cytochrome b/b6 domain-containing protein [Thiolapillus sp.]
MPQAEIRRLPVWGKALRLCHWGLALSVLVLLFSGWLIRWVPERADRIDDIHFLAAALLLSVLLVRLGLLFIGKGTATLNNLLPNRHTLNQAWAVVRSYLTLGKIRLPKWYAHNPLWAPVYLILFLVLVIQATSGLLLLNQITLLGDLSIRQIHANGYYLIAGFTLLHVLASFFHDAKGEGSDISAMISGQRIFIIEDSSANNPPTDNVVVRLDPSSFRKPEKS